jgi:hypothetical protein
MSNLQLWLAVAGGLVLVVVVAHSTWTSRQSQPKQAEPLVSQEELDALVAEPSAELGDDLQASNAFPGMPHELPHLDARSQLDALIDVIATMELDSPVSGEAAIAALPPIRRVGNKLFLVEGLNADSGEWETLQTQRYYSAFQAGMQVANRQGPLNDIEFSEFVVKTQAFAEVFSATPEFPDMNEVVAQARELDHFASAHDAQLGFTLASRKAAWSPGYVQQQAARLGFVPGVIPGRMVVPASTPGLPPVLVLTFDARAAMAEDPNQAALRSVSLSLDVPQVAQSEQAFSRLCEAAQNLAQAMDGLITDDNGHELSEAGIQMIDHDLRSLYDALAARDLSAGSLQARRLFS